MELTNNYTRTLVYLEGALLATQQSNGIPWASWEHRDPSNATYWSSDATNLRDRAELDPVGANMGLSDSTYTQSVPDEGSLSPYPSFSSGSSLGTTYSWDGIPMPVDEFFQMVGTLLHGPLGVVESFAKASANDANYQRKWVRSGDYVDYYKNSNSETDDMLSFNINSTRVYFGYWTSSAVSLSPSLESLMGSQLQEPLPRPKPMPGA